MTAGPDVGASPRCLLSYHNIKRSGQFPVTHTQSIRLFNCPSLDRFLPSSFNHTLTTLPPHHSSFDQQCLLPFSKVIFPHAVLQAQATASVSLNSFSHTNTLRTENVFNATRPTVVRLSLASSLSGSSSELH